MATLKITTPPAKSDKPDLIYLERMRALKSLINEEKFRGKVEIYGYLDEVHGEVVKTNKLDDLETMCCCGGCRIVLITEL